MTAGALRPALLSLGAAVALGVVASCARQGTPPGGPPDRLPPEVVRTRPDTFAELEVVDDPIRIEFSERISENPTRGTLDDAVLVSPRTGELRVSHEGDALEVDLSGGFRSGVAYRVTVLPVVQDLFGNAMPEPFEFLFSTGGEYTPNAVAGVVVDRITGEMVQDAEVLAHPDWTDTLDLVYVSRTDTAGIFALRYVPPGRYRLQAFQDRDRDGEADPFEIQGERLIPLGATDTLLSDLVILQPDTSAPRLAQA
ncbi:MAG TPA: Ig-like domain-containing protein, partial [Longimicrobiales bacterium]|nr:Ig-like domain-containing protein [Longimicrobiales bacterium]